MTNKRQMANLYEELEEIHGKLMTKANLYTQAILAAPNQEVSEKLAKEGKAVSEACTNVCKALNALVIFLDD